MKAHKCPKQFPWSEIFAITTLLFFCMATYSAFTDHKGNCEGGTAVLILFTWVSGMLMTIGICTENHG